MIKPRKKGRTEEESNGVLSSPPVCPPSPTPIVPLFTFIFFLPQIIVLKKIILFPLGVEFIRLVVLAWASALVPNRPGNDQTPNGALSRAPHTTRSGFLLFLHLPLLLLLLLILLLPLLLLLS